uniref:Uncharacterized protein n=1 Tax=Schistosoma japonicum TaxID=6182 RepID=Q5BXY0_SCHJA|nr:unknown [Schistosoma japonicum]
MKMLSYLAEIPFFQVLGPLYRHLKLLREKSLSCLENHINLCLTYCVNTAIWTLRKL